MKAGTTLFAILFAGFACVSATGCSKLVTYEPPPEKRLADTEKQAFEEAKGLAAKNDIAGAHSKLGQITVDSPMRATPEFRDIEDRWANAQLAKADAESDKVKKLALLQEIASSTTVSAEIRANATQKIDLASPQPAIPPPQINYDPAIAAATLEQAKALAHKRGGQKEIVALLQPRVAAGIASPDEVSLFKTACFKFPDCLAAMTDAGVPGFAELADAAASMPKKK